MGFLSSLFGSAPPPSGSVDDAFASIRAGRIEEGRALLRAICRHQPDDRDALVLTAYELSREPAQLKERQQLLNQIVQLDPKRAAVETRTLFAFLDVQRFDGEGYHAAYQGLPDTPPTTRPLAALYLLARILLSDCILQTRLLKPPQMMTSILVHPASQGAAQFVVRDPRAAATFARGLNAPEKTVAQYEEYVGRTLTDEERAETLDSVQLECAIGEGLLHLDQNQDAKARAAFTRARQSMYAGPTYDALNVFLF